MVMHNPVVVRAVGFPFVFLNTFNMYAIKRMMFFFLEYMSTLALARVLIRQYTIPTLGASHFTHM